MNVSACLVTRGDVDMQPVLDSLPPEWETVIYHNGSRISIYSAALGGGTGRGLHHIFGAFDNPISDLSVYGRYAAIEYASHDLIYVQDDDVIVSDPQAIVDAWLARYHEREPGLPATKTLPGTAPYPRYRTDHVACNMPSEFRQHYPDSGLVGFGAAFHRDTPKRAFDRFFVGPNNNHYTRNLPEFYRRADNVFTVLTPRLLVDVPKTDREMASDPNRMWKQPGHTAERDRVIELARRVRDDGK